MLTRTKRVGDDKRKLLEETIESRNRKTINTVYDKWWAEPETLGIQLIERKMDSVELIRQDSR